MSRTTNTEVARIAHALATALIELVRYAVQEHQQAPVPHFAAKDVRRIERMKKDVQRMSRANVATRKRLGLDKPAPVRKRTDVLSVLGKVPQPLRVIAERTGLAKHIVQDRLHKLAAQGLAKMEGNRRSAVWYAATHRNGVRASA